MCGNLTTNRPSPSDKVSIHSRQGLLLLAEGPVGALGEATVPATVSEMDEGGKHRERESLFRPGDILDCV